MNHPIPTKWSKWLHEKSGKTYVVIQITNQNATDKRYPITIVYKDTIGNIWSRPFSDWYTSMTRINESLMVRLVKFIFKIE